MSTPIDLGGGSSITDYDANRIVVLPPNGVPITIARAAAPPALQRAVSAAEGVQVMPGGAPRIDVSDQSNAAAVMPPPAPSAPAAPLGIDISDQATAAAVPQPEISEPETPAANMPPPPPASAYGEQSGELYPTTPSTPQVMRTGGSSTSSTTTTKVPDAAAAEARGLEGEVNAQRGKQADAIEAGGEVQARGESELQRVSAEHAKQIEQAQSDQTSDKEAYDRAFAANTTKLQELQKASQTEIDPRHWWKSKSTGNQILSAISLALGTFGANIARVQNTSLQMVDNAIQRDIEAQVTNREGKRQAANDQRSFMGLVAQKYDTDAQRRQAAYLLARDAAATQMETVGHAFKSEAAKATTLENAAAFRAQTAQMQQKFILDLAGSTTSSHSSTSTSQVVQGGAAGAGGVAAQNAAEFLNNVRRMAAEGTLNVIDGNALMTAYKTGRIPQKIYDQVASAERLQGIRKSINETVDEYYNAGIGSKEATAAQAKMALLAADVKGQAAGAKGSALDADEVAHIDANMPTLERTVGRPSTSGWVSGREAAHAKAGGAVAALMVPIEGNLRPYGLGIGKPEAPRPASAPFKSKDGRTYQLYTDGKVRVD